MSSPLTAPITGLLVAFGSVAASLADSPPQARGTAPPKPAPNADAASAPSSRALRARWIVSGI